jgi:hypothetical protein
MPTVRAPRRAVPSMTPTIMLMLIAGTAAIVVVSAFALRSTSSFLHVAAPTLLAGVALWMFLSEHYERTLAVLAIYLGVLDGYLKLKTGSTIATLGRDALLYAIAAGALVRFSFSGRRVRLPTLTPLVAVWVIICFAEVLNPVVPSFSHALAGVRQHVEFVPLFFLGFAVMRTERRLMGLFALLLLVAAVNGVVGLIQSNLSPAALAAWGPGYAKEVYGLGLLTGGARTFVTATGAVHVRPPALGSDFGFGGVVAAMALPGAMVLAAAGKRYRRYLPLVLIGVILAVVGLATSQARADLRFPERHFIVQPLQQHCSNEGHIDDDQLPIRHALADPDLPRRLSVWKRDRLDRACGRQHCRRCRVVLAERRKRAELPHHRGGHPWPAHDVRADVLGDRDGGAIAEAC